MDGHGAQFSRSANKRTSVPAGREQEALARQAGFAKAIHYEIGFNLMGVLVATKAK